MNGTKAILAIVAGGVMILLALGIKQFYAAKGILGASLSNQKIPNWKGRLLFVAIGAIMLMVGINFFLFGH